MFKEYSKGMGYVVLTIVILSVLGGVLNFAGVFAERVVVKNSFQYKEGMAQQASIWEAQLVELDIQIMQQTDQEVIAQLEGQKHLINARLRAVTLIK